MGEWVGECGEGVDHCFSCVNIWRRNHNGGGKIPSQLFPLLAIHTHIIHTHTHSSDETIVQKAAVAAVAARTFPATHPILKPTVAALHPPFTPPAADTHSFCFGGEFMITESPLKCSINNEHKSKSWLKCSILPPLAVTMHTHTYTMYTVWNSAESFCGSRGDGDRRSVTHGNSTVKYCMYVRYSILYSFSSNTGAELGDS